MDRPSCLISGQGVARTLRADLAGTACKSAGGRHGRGRELEKALSYVLATTTSPVRWYRFDVLARERPVPFELLDVLDLAVVPQFGDKKGAKDFAGALGLKTWRYVRL